jgi:hypothetical protein
VFGLTIKGWRNLPFFYAQKYPILLRLVGIYELRGQEFTRPEAESSIQELGLQRITMWITCGKENKNN